jgi:hypothetical protein
MSAYRILRRVVLGTMHEPTGKTRHFHGDRELPAAKVLQIVRYDEEEGFYLLRLDAAGKELTDTWHDSLEDAFAQAEWEYRLKADEWETVLH